RQSKRLRVWAPRSIGYEGGYCSLARIESLFRNLQRTKRNHFGAAMLQGRPGEDKGAYQSRTIAWHGLPRPLRSGTVSFRTTKRRGADGRTISPVPFAAAQSIPSSRLARGFAS